VQSLPINTNIVSSNPNYVEMYLIQHFVIKFVSHLRQAGWCFSLGTMVSSTNKTEHHDITEILLKVASNTITLTPKILYKSECNRVSVFFISYSE